MTVTKLKPMTRDKAFDTMIRIRDQFVTDLTRDDFANVAEIVNAAQKKWDEINGLVQPQQIIEAGLILAMMWLPRYEGMAKTRPTPAEREFQKKVGTN
jgi:hypothetical protein